MTQNSVLVSPSRITLYLADMVNIVNKALNIEERAISPDAILLSILLPLNLE
jgi:hypothetical protein